MTGTLFYMLDISIKDRSSLAFFKVFKNTLSVEAGTFLQYFDVTLAKKNKSLYNKFKQDAGIGKEEIFRPVTKSYAALYVKGAESIAVTNPPPSMYSTYRVDGDITNYDEFLTVLRTALFIYGLEHIIAKRAVEVTGPNTTNLDTFDKAAYMQFYKIVKLNYPNVAFSYNSSNKMKSQVFNIGVTPVLGSGMKVDPAQYDLYNTYITKMSTRRI